MGALLDDAQARSLDRGADIMVEPAAAGRTGPARSEPALEAGDRPMVGSSVLEEPHAAARPKDTPALLEGCRHVSDRAEDDARLARRRTPLGTAGVASWG